MKSATARIRGIVYREHDTSDEQLVDVTLQVTFERAVVRFPMETNLLCDRLLSSPNAKVVNGFITLTVRTSIMYGS